MSSISITEADCFSWQEEDTAGSGYYEDEDTRLFYESLPDLRAVVPGVVLARNSSDIGPAGDLLADGGTETSAASEAQVNDDMGQVLDSETADAEAGREHHRKMCWFIVML